MLANVSICFDMSAFNSACTASPETSAKLSGNSTSPGSSVEGSPVDVRVAQRKALIARKKQDIADMKAWMASRPPIVIKKRTREEVLLSDEEAWAADEVNAKEAAEAAASARAEAAAEARAKAADEAATYAALEPKRNKLNK